MPRTAKNQTVEAPAKAAKTTTKAPVKGAKTQAAKAATKQAPKVTPAPKRGKTLASKMNDVFYRTLYQDLCGPGDAKNPQPGTLAIVLAQGNYRTPEDYEAVLREWVDSRFGKTHKRTGFMMFSESNRAKVQEKLGTKAMAQVSKELGAQWKSLKDTQKDAWNKKAAAWTEKHGVRDFTPAPRRGAGAKAATPEASNEASESSDESEGDDSSSISSESD
jgi:hypothetical protein